ncbi:GFA family protein [Shewanella avicenniae]|uniref:GFA family protein n=1 Tax=Shewanella avicenniae TaxID=2814294 RepID=A0ABX7QLD6_9GAMM|nr:GFA family protein [Shewanella avicenniae]QSX32264.1 GFA family protein [Shewanella avicenniae]
MAKVLLGGCCCGSVSFSVMDDFRRFYFCYCEQCRKLTGSAHAANLFTAPDNITWLSGQDKLKRYDHPTRAFSKVFCSECGSGLPFLIKNQKYLIVPAGSLHDEPSKTVDAQIFCEEQLEWHKSGVTAPKRNGFG